MPLPTYSGAELKARDKAINDRHDKEKAGWEARYNRQRHAYDALSEQHFEAVNRSNNTASQLGFRTMAELYSYVSGSPEQIPLQDLVERAERLEERLGYEEEISEGFKEERDAALKELEDERQRSESLRQQLEAEKATSTRRALEWKARFSAYRKFKKFCEEEELQFKKKVKGLKPEARDEARLDFCLRRTAAADEAGLNDECLKALFQQEEEEDTQEARGVIASSPLPASSPIIATPSTKATPAAAMSSVALAAGTLADAFPALPPVTGELKKICGELANAFATIRKSEVIDLSESQPPDAPVSTPSPSIRSRPSTGVKPHPMFAPPPDPVSPKKKKQHRYSEVHVRRREEDDEVEERSPSKRRRYSSPVRQPLKSNAISRSPKYAFSPNRGRENRRSTNKNAVAGSSKQPVDYSVYKGRGRYGKAGAGDETINGNYAIDPTRNGGVNYQFAEVVRGKEDRRRLQGGDCEECRDYYEAVGPLPPRLQAPLWRSPPSSPVKGRTCNHQREVAAHKQAISRHREEWAQGTTPPNYWDIGFPTTQEADSINAKAKKMHEQKLKRVKEDTRYYKTR
ncbi:SAE2 domain-containing protein [Mycena kentingensis (nom. inval.)]|nr:SAE2 domain-containing protein [Mycena kentingensis (nom. inval.)]